MDLQDGYVYGSTRKFQDTFLPWMQNTFLPWMSSATSYLYMNMNSFEIKLGKTQNNNPIFTLCKCFTESRIFSESSLYQSDVIWDGLLSVLRSKFCPILWNNNISLGKSGKSGLNRIMDKIKVINKMIEIGLTTRIFKKHSKFNVYDLLPSLSYADR